VSTEAAAPAPTQEAVKEIGVLLDHIGAVTPDADVHSATDPEGSADDTAPENGPDERGPSDLDGSQPEQEASTDLAIDPETDADQISANDDEPITVASLAKELGVEAKDIYNELEIPLGEGESVTLGQFKDRVKDLRELDTQRETFSTEKAEQEKGQLRDRALLNTMLELIGPELARPAYQAAQEQLETWQDDQRGQILEAIPEWQDPDALAKDRDSIVGLGQEYGFSEVEMTGVLDARTVRMLRDFAVLQNKVKSADLASKKKPALPGKKGKANRQQRRGALADRLNKAKASNNESIKAGGIGELLIQAGAS
jgi:hypothetical protein